MIIYNAGVAGFAVDHIVLLGFVHKPTPSLVNKWSLQCFDRSSYNLPIYIYAIDPSLSQIWSLNSHPLKCLRSLKMSSAKAQDSVPYMSIMSGSWKPSASGRTEEIGDTPRGRPRASEPQGPSTFGMLRFL